MNHESLRTRAAVLAAGALLVLSAACGGSTLGGNGGDGGNGAGGNGAGKACVIGGCSGQTCEEEGNQLGGTCEWNDVYACYQKLGICERGAMGDCGFRQTAELTACVAAEGRMVASGQCVRNAGDACSSDADCQAGGCGGELCYNPAASQGASTCDCTTPDGPSCGCVSGQCAWWSGP